MITIDPPSSSAPERPLLSKPALTRFFKRACAAVDLHGAVDVLLTTDAEVKRLNRTFRGKNRATDVLSFPAEPVPGLPAEEQHAGDLAISLETAGRQAERFGHTLEVEVRVLMLHGLLHLAGHDHETDAGEMRDLEGRLRAELKLPLSLIERTEQKAAARRPGETPVKSKATKTGRERRV